MAPELQLCRISSGSNFQDKHAMKKLDEILKLVLLASESSTVQSSVAEAARMRWMSSHDQI